MASFDIAQQYIEEKEGRYQNNDTDKGNWTGGAIGVGIKAGTNFGISAPTLSAWRKHPVTEAEMQALTYTEALQIYKALYWNYVGGDKIKNQSIATMLYDGAVNQGAGRMRGIIASILGITVTVPFSQTVIDAINNYPNQQLLFRKIAQARIAHYQSIGFGQSFFKRVNGIVWEAVTNPVEFVTKNFIVLAAASILLAAGVLGVIYLANHKKI